MLGPASRVLLQLLVMLVLPTPWRATICLTAGTKTPYYDPAHPDKNPGPQRNVGWVAPSSTSLPLAAEQEEAAKAAAEAAAAEAKAAAEAAAEAAERHRDSLLAAQAKATAESAAAAAVKVAAESVEPEKKALLPPGAQDDGKGRLAEELTAHLAGLGIAADSAACLGLGRIVALYNRSSTPYHIR